MHSKVYLIALVLGVMVMNVENKIVQKMMKIDQKILDRILPVIMGCAEEHGIDTTMISKFKTKNPDHDNMKEFFLCSFVRTGRANEDGQMIIDKVLKYYPPGFNTDIIVPVLEECNKQNGEPKDKVFKFYKCYEENVPVIMTLDDPN